MFPKDVFSKNHVGATVLKHLEYDGYLQTGGEGPGRLYLANGFLETAICKLQHTTSPRFPSDPQVERVRIAVMKRFRIAVLRALAERQGMQNLFLEVKRLRKDELSKGCGGVL